MDPTLPGDPFGPYLFADCVRLLLAAGGVFMVMLCLRVMWLRSRAPADSPLRRDRSPLAIGSYAAFAIVPTGNAVQFLGQEPDAGLLAWFAFCLSLGLFAAFGQVHIRWWRSAPDPTHKDTRT